LRAEEAAKEIPMSIAPQPTDPSATTTTALSDLADQLPGRVVLPGDPNWDQARQAWNLAVDQHPVAVALPGDPTDVATVVRHAAATGLRLAFQATGHGAATLDLDGVVLVRTDGLQGVAVDPTTGRAWIAAGALARDVVAAAAPHGLSFLSGSSPDVGVVGYTLGGGIGWLARRFGLACNTVTGAEVVTADGAVRRVDRDHDPDLFWALRGGGGSFAAVTALEAELFPIAEVHAGTLLWPLDQAAEVLRTWARWTADLPDTVTSIARLLRYPPLPDLPDHLRGRQLVGVEAVFLAGDDDAAIRLRPLRALGPEIDTFATRPATELITLHGDPEHPVPGVATHRLLNALPDEAIDALLALAGPEADSPLLAVDLRHLGGALATSGPDHGALDRIDAAYALFAIGIPMGPELAAALPVHLDAVERDLRPWDAGREYLNFAERPVAPDRLFAPTVYERLRAVRATYDPDGRFVSNHRIESPATD
jgi:FAD/FMN-containing dehydrogenase